MAKLEDVILSDTRANQPAASAVAAGTLYFVTDEDVLERSDGSAWAEVAINTDGHAAVDHTGITGVGGGSGGAILQVVTAVSTTDDATTNGSGSPAVSSLSATITPQAADSTLLISVDGECLAQRNSGTPTGRYMYVQIYNSTDAAVVTAQRRGRVLDTASAVAAASLSPIGLRGRYTVNSTTARTFQLRFYTITDNTCSILGATSGPALMTIMEIAA